MQITQIIQNKKPENTSYIPKLVHLTLQSHNKTVNQNVAHLVKRCLRLQGIRSFSGLKGGVRLYH